MNIKIVIFFDVDSRRVQDTSQDVFLAPHRGPRRPLVKWIRSKGGLLGGSWTSKSSPGLKFREKYWANFNIVVFRFGRFFEEPKRRPITRRAPQEASKESLEKSMESEWSPNGGSRVGRGGV